jgi:hypothetical protein
VVEEEEEGKEVLEQRRETGPWSMWKLEWLVGQRGARRVLLEELRRGAKIGEFKLRVRVVGAWAGMECYRGRGSVGMQKICRSTALADLPLVIMVRCSTAPNEASLLSQRSASDQTTTGLAVARWRTLPRLARLIFSVLPCRSQARFITR